MAISAINGTLNAMLAEVVDNVVDSNRVSLIAFFSGFGLVSVLLIAQFAAGVRTLAKTNYRALKTIASIPKDELNKMKGECDRALARLNRLGDEETGLGGDEQPSYEVCQ